MSLIERADPRAHRARRRHGATGTTSTTPSRASTSSRCSSPPQGRRRRGVITQRKDRPDPATFIGKGKIEELLEVCLDVDADTVVFDNELTPGAAVQLGEAARAHGDRSHRGDPRHLRPERAHPRRQGPGRARVAALPVASAATRSRPARCHSRRVASAPVVRARPSSRPIAAGCNDASRSSSTT